MIWFLARRLGGFVLTLIVSAGLIFLFLPKDTSLGAWLGSALTMNFGAQSGQIGAGLAVTIPLALTAMILATLVGVGVGLLATRSPGAVLDRVLTAALAVGIATPSIWLGMLLVLLFAVALRWLPTAGFVPWSQNFGAALMSLALPAVALALPKAAVVARLVRRTLREVQEAPYLAAVAARGLTTQDAMRRHGWRNAAAALVRPLAIEAATLIAGTAIVENVFYLPGLGQLIFNAILAGDVAVIRAGTMVLVLLLAGTLFVIGLCEAWADPRLQDGAMP